MAQLLLVDDEPAPTAFDRWLKKRGHVALRIDNVADAIACIAKLTFDVVIVDMMLPTKSIDTLLNLSETALRAEVKNQKFAGLRVYDALLSAPGQCAVIFHTAYPEYVIKNLVDTSRLRCSFVARNRGPHTLCEAIDAALSTGAV
jgi:CheY-like chemotaxis protein